MSDLILNNAIDFDIATLCFILNRKLNPEVLQIHDSTNPPIVPIPLPTDLPFIAFPLDRKIGLKVQGGRLFVSYECSWNLDLGHRTTKRYGVLKNAYNTSFRVTRSGGGIGIADIRDGQVPFRCHVFNLTECPIVLSIGRRVVKGIEERTLEFEFICKSNDCEVNFPRPNESYDVFSPSSNDC